MDIKIIFRSFQEGDYKTVNDWWKWWWKGEYIEREFLPSDDSCFIIEKNNIPVVSGFLYLCKNAPIAYLTYIVSNPEYKELDRREIIELLINKIEEESKKLGVKLIFTVCGDRNLTNIHKKLDWYVHDNRQSYESFKIIK